MRVARRAGIVVAAVLLIGIVGYTGYVGYEGSRQLLAATRETIDCRTPDLQFGWSYEAINYDIVDDALLRDTARNPDPMDCSYEGTKAGDAVVTEDGIRIAGWYIPAADGGGPDGPTIVLVHGFMDSKSGILKYAAGLHQTFNLVAFDMRNVGRSTGSQSTGGVFEQRDLRAIIDWVERTKHPSHLGVLGNSLGAATALAEARDDARVEALALDSMHTRLRYQIEARVRDGGYPSYFGTTWAIQVGARLRSGADIGSIDAEDILKDYGTRPLLITHGTMDTEDLPSRTQALYQQALALGIPARIEWCPKSGHNAPLGMPPDVCAADFQTWTRDFFVAALR